MHISQTLFNAGIRCFPVNERKEPIKGSGSWKDLKTPDAYRFEDHGMVGVPIPTGVLIIDLDVYKGVTRYDVEKALVATLPWDLALIQKTLNGGEHYAFTVDSDNLIQGSDILGVVGFDTRCAGRGYIATGCGYTQIGLGVSRLGYPQSLPTLPNEAVQVLTKKEKTAPVNVSPTFQEEISLDKIKTALAFLNPDCDYTAWLEIIMSLNAIFSHDPQLGLEYATKWSRGDFYTKKSVKFTGDEDVKAKWDSVSPGGGIGPATFYYRAMENGWRAPIGFDVASILGVNTDAFVLALDDIQENSVNAKEHPRLINLVLLFKGDASQQAVLKSALLKALKEEGMLSAEVKEVLKGKSRSALPEPGPKAIHDEIVESDHIPFKQISAPSTNLGMNAAMMVSEVFGGRVASFQVYGFRWWTGREWQLISNFKLERLVASALMPEYAKNPQAIAGTVKMLPLLSEERQPGAPNRCVFFKNGVLDLNTDIFHAHHRDNNNLGTLSVDYDPIAPREEWDMHMSRVFGGLRDGEDRIQLLQEVLGWVLITDSLGIEKVIAFDGVTRAGKGVILNALYKILGAKVNTAALGDLADHKSKDVFIDHDVIIDFEAKISRKSDTGDIVKFINELASNEVVSIKQLYSQRPYTGRLNSKFIFACNGMPTLIDDSGASSSRFITLVFERSFYGKEDLGISKRMEGCLTGIAAWAVEGVKRLIRNDGVFTMPESSISAMDNLLDANQPLQEFLENYCQIEEGLKCHWGDLWEAYKVFCSACNIKLPRRQMFKKSFHQAVLGNESVEEKRRVRIGDKILPGFYGLSTKQKGNVVPLQAACNKG